MFQPEGGAHRVVTACEASSGSSVFRESREDAAGRRYLFLVATAQPGAGMPSHLGVFDDEFGLTLQERGDLSARRPGPVACGCGEFPSRGSACVGKNCLRRARTAASSSAISFVSPSRSEAHRRSLRTRSFGREPRTARRRSWVCQRHRGLPARPVPDGCASPGLRHHRHGRVQVGAGDRRLGLA